MTALAPRLLLAGSLLLTAVALSACLSLTSNAEGATGPSTDAIQDYVQRLRNSGFADLAAEYLTRRLTKPDLSENERADLEFEIAESLLVASERLKDLSRRERMLNEARQRFGEFSQKNPKHPRRAESLVQAATVDLQKGRLKILEAQLPANAARSLELADEGRTLLRRAADDYAKARDQLHAEYQALPVFIPDERPEDRARRQHKSDLFRAYMDARFQAGVALFHLADSYKSVEIPANHPKGAELRNQWKSEFQAAIGKAYRLFEQMQNEYRREGIGLFAHLWMARCLAAEGKFRQARGILDLLTKHENRELAALQREVFYLQLIILAADKDYASVIAKGEEWRKKNTKFLRESAGLGIELEMARAYATLAAQEKDSAAADRHGLEANKLLDHIASFTNPYSGLARREQLRLAEAGSQGPRTRGFAQIHSLASAKLDLITPDLPAAERTQRLREVARLWEQALATLKGTEDIESVQQARLSLAYVYLECGLAYQAAILSEFIAREHPKSAAAPRAALFAVAAYAAAFDEALTRQRTSGQEDPRPEAKRLVRAAGYLTERWPEAEESDDARLMVGRLELARKDYAAAARALDGVPAASRKSPEALGLAGLAYWDWYRSASKGPAPDRKKLEELRRSAIDRLRRAQEKQPAEAGAISRRHFLNRAVLAEALFDAGEDEPAAEAVAPLVAAISAGKLAPEVDQPLRTAGLVTALEIAIRRAKADETDKLIALVSGSSGSGPEAGQTTGVFLGLASKLKEQIARLKTTGDEVKRRTMVDSFSRFLDRIADRETGQTLSSLVFLAENFLELGKPSRAAELLERARQSPEAADPTKLSLVLRARMLLARARKDSGQFDLARKEIDELLRENLSARDIIMERGAILEAAAGSSDPAEAIKHWKWYLKRLAPTRPRPPDFYEVMDRLLTLYERSTGPEPSARAAEGIGYARFLLANDVTLPGEWKPIFEEHLRRLQAKSAQR